MKRLRPLPLLLTALAALVVQSFFFLVIPVLNALFGEIPRRERAEIAEPVQVDQAVVKPRQRQNRREIKPIRSQLRLKAPRATAGGPSRAFSMDLSLATGTGSAGGVAVGAGGGAASNAVYEAGQVDAQAVELSGAKVDYPKRALRERVPGHVVLLLVVETDGSVSSVELLSVDPPGYGFESAAIAAMKGYRFQPAKIDGVPVRQRYSKEFFFDAPD
jgi:protein TonB